MDRMLELFESTLTSDDPNGIQSLAHFESMLETQNDINMAAAFTVL